MIVYYIIYFLSLVLYSYNGAKAKIIESIKTGSKGKYRNFTDIEMPPYSHLKADELNTLADWILTEYDKKGNSQGKGKKRSK